VTRNNWQFRCLPSMAYGGGGEAFLAVAPDATQYRFDWMVSRGLAKMSKTRENPDPLAALTGGARSDAPLSKGGTVPMPNSSKSFMNLLNRPSTTDCSTASVPAARKISCQYDPLNRLGQTTFVDGSPLIKREYTSDGLPYAITSNGATWTNSYNKRRLDERGSTTTRKQRGGQAYVFDLGSDCGWGVCRCLGSGSGPGYARGREALGQLCYAHEETAHGAATLPSRDSASFTGMIFGRCIQRREQ
jgi:hypothetical protein